MVLFNSLQLPTGQISSVLSDFLAGKCDFSLEKGLGHLLAHTWVYNSGKNQTILWNQFLIIPSSIPNLSRARIFIMWSNAFSVAFIL